MQGFASKILGRIPMTTTIAAMVVTAVVLSVGAVVAAVYVNLSSNQDEVAYASQQSNVRTAATVLGGMGGIQVTWSEAGDVEAIGTWVMPRFYNNDVADSVARVTGESAAIFAWNTETAQFEQVTTSIVDANGERVVMDPIAADSQLHARILEEGTIFTENDVAGQHHYAVYQPITYLSGTDVLGLL